MLINGNYTYIVNPSDIISVAGSRVRFRTAGAAVFGVGKGAQPGADCESCVDCDTKPTNLCFVGSVSEGEGFGVMIFWVFGIFWIFFKFCIK